MKSLSKNKYKNQYELRRCRPLLGTFVEVAAAHETPEAALLAVNAAFCAVERVVRLMSFHNEESEVSLLNRRAAYESVRVSSETYFVLQVAQRLSEESNGIFDITVAGELVCSKILPRHPFYKVGKSTSARDIRLLRNQTVRFLRPLQIDLGGIAKGFAVDCAVEAMKKEGARRGIVNAGGDIRCFGKKKYPLFVRHPASPGKLLSFPLLYNAAFATSANSYSYEKSKRVRPAACAHIDGRTRLPLFRSYSISVKASSCLIADALTKVVLALEEGASPLLAKFHAEAFIVRAKKGIMLVKENT